MIDRGVLERLAECRPYTADDILMLARAAHGEGARLFGKLRDEVAMWIVHTAINRSRKPWWNRGVARETELAFHGTHNVEVPADWAIAIAVGSLACGHDYADGALFMLSGRDMVEQRLTHRQGEAVKSFVVGNHSF